jgi:hypothetical protein
MSGSRWYRWRNAWQRSFARDPSDTPRGSAHPSHRLPPPLPRRLRIRRPGEGRPRSSSPTTTPCWPIASGASRAGRRVRYRDHRWRRGAIARRSRSVLGEDVRQRPGIKGDPNLLTEGRREV